MHYFVSFVCSLFTASLVGGAILNPNHRSHGRLNGSRQQGPEAVAVRRPVSRANRGNLRRLAQTRNSAYESQGASVNAEWETKECEHLSSLSFSASTTSSRLKEGGESSDTTDESASFSLEMWSDCNANSATRTSIFWEMFGGEQPFTLTVDPGFESAAYSSISDGTIYVETCSVNCYSDFEYGDYCNYGNCTYISEQAAQAQLDVTWTATDPPSNSSWTSKSSDATSSNRSTYKSLQRTSSVAFSLLIDGETFEFPEEATLRGTIQWTSGTDINTTY